MYIVPSFFPESKLRSSSTVASLIFDSHVPIKSMYGRLNGGGGGSEGRYMVPV